jgi:aspartyl-tRNA(Asn)/glutamyl-tRNA(Gln) amidotransferase subunit A
VWRVNGEMSVARLAADVRAGRVRARDVAEERLARSEERADLGAVWELTAERARAEADAVDRAVAHGRDPGPLAGVPVGWKACFDLAGLVADAGAPALRLPAATADAPVVARLRDAGAVAIGHLAMEQLAWGMTGQSPGRPPCRNPFAPGRVPGGSSSGSAVAIAAGLCDLAPGTDAGGSVRVPASYCGLVGFKPTFGAIPLDGCVPYCPSVDTAGPLGRSVADCALCLDLLRGREPAPVRPVPLQGLRVGVLGTHFAEVLDVSVDAAVGAALERVAAAGAVLDPVDLFASRPERVHDFLRALGVVYACEPLLVAADAVAREPEAFLPVVVADVAAGLPISALDYLRACRQLADGRAEAVGVFERVDVVACATAPLPPVPLDASDRTTTMNRNTKPFNGLRWPVITLPCGRDADGLPVGLQLAAAPGDDDRLLAVAAAVERLLEEGP